MGKIEFGNCHPRHQGFRQAAIVRGFNDGLVGITTTTAVTIWRIVSWKTGGRSLFAPKITQGFNLLEHRRSTISFQAGYWVKAPCQKCGRRELADYHYLAAYRRKEQLLGNNWLAK